MTAEWIAILFTVCAYGVISSAGQYASVVDDESQSRAEEIGQLETTLDDNDTRIVRTSKRGALVIQNGRPDALFNGSDPVAPVDGRDNSSIADSTTASENGTSGDLSLDSQPLAQVNVFQLYVVPAKRKKRLRAFDHLPGCPNDAIQFIKTSNFDPSLKRHVFRSAFATSADECANLCHTHFFCRSAGYEPLSDRCLLSYRRSVLACDGSSATAEEPSLADDIRTSDWWLWKIKEGQDDDGYENEPGEDASDVWLDCDRCGTAPKRPEDFRTNGTNITVSPVPSANGAAANRSPKPDSDVDRSNLSNPNVSFHFNLSSVNESQLNGSSHQANKSSWFSDALNRTALNANQVNKTDLASNATHSNRTEFADFNVTKNEFGIPEKPAANNATVTPDETRINWTSPIGNHSWANNSSVNETLDSLGDKYTNISNGSRRVTSSSILGNATHETGSTLGTSNAAWHPKANLSLDNGSLHSSSNLSLEDANLQSNWSLENSTFYLNLTSETNTTSHRNATSEDLSLLNSTSESAQRQNSTLRNPALGDSSSNSNLTLENVTLHSNLTSENASIDSNVTVGNSSLHHFTFSVTFENDTSTNVSADNATTSHSDLSHGLSNLTEGEHKPPSAGEGAEATTLGPASSSNAPSGQPPSLTSTEATAEGDTSPFSVTRRARKFTRRPFTRHVEIVGNFSSAAGSYVGGDVEEEI